MGPNVLLHEGEGPVHVVHPVNGKVPHFVGSKPGEVSPRQNKAVEGHRKAMPEIHVMAHDACREGITRTVGDPATQIAHVSGLHQHEALQIRNPDATITK
eukprot:TRINITY_DN16123_c0_g1_i1.p2 TRINITY_DN16123_c0_g1~~TRINITY_DN16123_c0_g1_i1.p2  ORF type:complete len:100 (-),score=3.04 TRINITY_DN16123_c0_g1_i1:525-824(-)